MIRAGQSEYFTSFRTVSDTRSNWAVIISVHLGIFVNDLEKKSLSLQQVVYLIELALGHYDRHWENQIRDTEINRPFIINLEYFNYLNIAKSGVL